MNRTDEDSHLLAGRLNRCSDLKVLCSNKAPENQWKNTLWFPFPSKKLLLTLRYPKLGLWMVTCKEYRRSRKMVFLMMFFLNSAGCLSQIPKLLIESTREGFECQTMPTFFETNSLFGKDKVYPSRNNF